MKVTDKIVRKINQTAAGDVFGYDTLGLNTDEFAAGAKALGRLVEKGVIKRARKGYYYKPKVSSFGEQRPREDVMLGLYLYDKNKQTAYITGTRLYNRLGLTTQVPGAVRIASLDKQIKGMAGSLIVKPAKSYVKVTSDRVRYLEFLDVLKDFNSIADLNKQDGLAYLQKTIQGFTAAELKKLTTYGLAYPPKVRAFLGALLQANTDADVKLLKKSINPASRYLYGLSGKILATVNDWNIS